MRSVCARCLLSLPVAATLIASTASAEIYYEDDYDEPWIYSEPAPPSRGRVWHQDSLPSRAIAPAPQHSRSHRYIPPYDDEDAMSEQPAPIRPPRSLGGSKLPTATGPAPTPAPEGMIPSARGSVMSLPPEDQPEIGTPRDLPGNLRRQVVAYNTREPAGTIIIDTPNTYLYLVLGDGKALRYGIGVGREGFTWSGTERISRMKEWPDWFPPSEMIERQPYLPRVMAGGPGNPLGARALYLGNTLYRIHGTNQPSTIGQTVSSGCIRLLNEDIEDLYGRVRVGTRVLVLPARPQETMAHAHPTSR